jgi:signal transduction histidine kinase
VGVLLSLIGILAVSLVAFLMISNQIERQYLNPVFEAMDELELESARSALETGGAAALSSYLEKLNQLFKSSSHFLLDSDGVDVLSGKNRKDLLPPAPALSSRSRISGKFVVTHRSKDARYWFVAEDARQPNNSTLFPFYMLVIGVIAVLGWLVTLGVVSPVRRLTATVDEFGRGELSTRTKMSRRDEIGELARSFDAMADRIETLVTSERRLLQDISHELRSPLTRLKLAVRLARSAPDEKAALDRVDRETNRITSLVSEIVEMARLEGDPATRSMEPVNLQRVIDETVDDCRIEAQLFRGCEIRVGGRISGEVSGDRELLRRGIENVVRNAIRYSPEKACIEIDLAEGNTGTSITVRDYGPGVPEELLHQIFEPFFRVEQAREEESGGIGIGLSIAKRSIRLHRGTIVAENAQPGLRVQITIPALISVGLLPVH